MIGPRYAVPSAFLAITLMLAAGAARSEPSATADGYRGIWYMNQPTGDEHRYKYSGGMATYPQQHMPIAIYSNKADKTFFCYGGATERPKELAYMVSYFDHATGMVPRPRQIMTKPTDDAHENPTLAVDDAGHLWVFGNTHGPAERSYIFRSTRPYSIDEFEQIAKMNFSYSQPWFVPGEGFLFLHTRYQGGRRLLYWMTRGRNLPLPPGEGRGEGDLSTANVPSPYPLPQGEGLGTWSEPQPLAQVAQGHYQVSNRRGNRVATAFNYHPSPGGLNARTNLYYLETADMGATWRTAAGETVITPLTDAQNPALVRDFEAKHRLVYLKDLNFDTAGRPVILFLTTGGYAPGPAAGQREWFTAHWTGGEWRIRPFATSDHNYDFGSLYIDADEWRIIAPTEPGPQPWATGGEMVLWSSDDQGGTWTKSKQLTEGSELNHTYARRPLNAHPQIYALWADGNALKPSQSQLYFTDREGSHVWRLPSQMSDDFAKPEAVW